MVLHESALAHNIEAMAAYCAAAGVSHAPHGKTPMAPQLIARQLAAGAWAVSAATAAQARVYRAFGVPRVLIASQLTSPRGRRVAGPRAGRRPRLRVLHLRRQPGRRGPARRRPARRRCPAAAAGAGRAGLPRRPDRLPEHRRGPGRGRRRARSADGLELAGAAGFEGGIERADLDATLAAVAVFLHRSPDPGRAAARLRRRPRPPAGPERGRQLVLRRRLPRAGPGRRRGSCCAAAPTSPTTTGTTPRAARPAARTCPACRPAPQFAGRSSCGPPCCRCPSPAWPSSTPAAATSPVTRACPCRCGCAGPGVTEAAAGLRLTNLDDQHGYLRHHRRRWPAGPRRPGQPGQHPPVHDHGQVAGHPRRR